MAMPFMYPSRAWCGLGPRFTMGGRIRRDMRALTGALTVGKVMVSSATGRDKPSARWTRASGNQIILHPSQQGVYRSRSRPLQGFDS